MIYGVEGADPDRRDKLIDFLDIDINWRIHKISDDQGRRVQICMGLLHPLKVIQTYGVPSEIFIRPPTCSDLHFKYPVCKEDRRKQRYKRTSFWTFLVQAIGVFSKITEALGL